MELCALIHNGSIFYCKSFCELIFRRTKLKDVCLMAYYNSLYDGILRGSNRDQSLLH